MVDNAIMNGPMDYNILLGHDYIYAMDAMMYSLFWVMLFRYEGCIVISDQMSYCDPSSHTSHDRILNYIPPIESIHYISTSIKCAKPIPIVCELMTLKLPPHHYDQEAKKTNSAHP